MNKTYRAKLMSVIEQMPKHDLSKLLDKLYSWTENHEKKKASYFWSPPSFASSRRWEEKKKSFEESVVIGESKICYWSDCSMSCKHIYWKDGIYLEDGDAKINFGDVATIIEAIEKQLDDGAEEDSGAKLDFSKMHDIRHGSFTYNGKEWHMVDEHSGGTSARGLWIIVTDGENFSRVYKKDMLDKGFFDRALALFN